MTERSRTPAAMRRNRRVGCCDQTHHASSQRTMATMAARLCDGPVTGSRDAPWLGAGTREWPRLLRSIRRIPLFRSPRAVLTQNESNTSCLIRQTDPRAGG